MTAATGVLYGATVDPLLPAAFAGVDSLVGDLLGREPRTVRDEFAAHRTATW